jgi:hypothetical protein
MKASWRKGLSGAVSAIVIAVVLVAGLASASYINLTTARYNEAQMQEALRQARLGSELIRIHIHSTDGAVDSPPRITFVNAWGYESRIIQLVVIARDMTPVATIDLRGRPIVLPPGARMTIEPSQIGLSYPTFKRMADELRSIHAYTEAGNSFGSTWGFPREDNMAGRTMATTYNATTSEIWYVPVFSQVNKTFTVGRYMTIGDIPDTDLVKVVARNHFEKARVDVGARLGRWVCNRQTTDLYTGELVCVEWRYYGPDVRITHDDSMWDGYPPAPGPRVEASGCIGGCWEGQANSHWLQVGGVSIIGIGGHDLDWTQWRWYPQDGWVEYMGPVMHHEISESIYGYNAPNKVVIQVGGEDGICTITYLLGRTTVTPSQPGFRPTESTYTRTYYPTSPYPNNPVSQTLLLSVARVFRLNPEPITLSSPTTQIYTTHVAGTTSSTATITYTTSFDTSTPYTTWTTHGFTETFWKPFMTTQTITYTTTISWLIPLTLTQTTVRTAVPVDTTIDRYYYVADVKCELWDPPPPPSVEIPRPGPPDPWATRTVSPVYCTVIEDQITVPVQRAMTLGVRADGSPIIEYVTNYEVRLIQRRIC